MFLQNMSSDELAAEYKKDLPEIQKLNNEFDQSAYISRMLDRKHKVDTLYFTKIFTTQRSNRYINVFMYIRKPGTSKRERLWNWSVESIGEIQTRKGVCFIAFLEDGNIALKMQTHFFNRYKERFLTECDWKTKARILSAKTLEDLVAVYISRNLDAALLKTNVRYADREHIFAPVNDGAMLIQLDNRNLQANTFITKSMYSYYQKQMLDKINARRENERNVQMATRKLIELMQDEQNQTL